MNESLKNINKSIAPIEIQDINLPNNYTYLWNMGQGPFWMVCVQRLLNDTPPKIFERWHGVLIKKPWLRCMIDLAPIENWCYINGENKFKLAFEFINKYGGKASFQSEEIDFNDPLLNAYLNPENWGEGTENLSSEVDEVVYGDKK